MDAQTERADVLRRLKNQRQQILALFSKSANPAVRNLVQRNGFPRSHTMRLLMSDPAFTTGLKAVTIHYLGSRNSQYLHVLLGAFRITRSVFQDRARPPP